MQDRRSKRLACALAFAALGLASCAQQKPLYNWSGYEASTIYAHFQHRSSPEQQILDIEKALAVMAAKQEAVPPGLYAHLGLQYLNVGKQGQAEQAWTREKELFPESARFIDYLLGNMKKKAS